MATTNNIPTLWFQLEDMFQLIGTPQGIEKVIFQLFFTLFSARMSRIPI